MANVLVCTAQVPFASGGAERHAAGLVRELKARGHRADLVQLPFKWYPREEILLSAMSWRLVDVTEADGTKVDLVVPMKFPSYLVRHPNKVVWLIHQFRQAYDRFGTEQSDFTASPEDTRWRELIAEADATGLGEARKVFTNARNTADRLMRFNGIEAEALYHPPPLAGRYRDDGPGRYALVVGRLDPWKRMDLAIEGAAAAGFPLVIAGSGPDEERLRKAAARTGADVDFRGAVSDEELLVALRRLRRRPLHAGRRGLRLHRPRGVPLEKAGRHLHRFRRPARVRRRRRDGSRDASRRRGRRGGRCGAPRFSGPRRRDGGDGATRRSAA